MPDQCFAPQVNATVDVMADATPEGQDPTYTTVFQSRVPLQIMTTAGDETYRGRQLEGHVTHVLDAPYFVGLTPKMQILVRSGLYKDRTLNVEHVRPYHKPGQVPRQEIYCRELT